MNSSGNNSGNSNNSGEKQRGNSVPVVNIVTNEQRKEKESDPSLILYSAVTVGLAVFFYYFYYPMQDFYHGGIWQVISFLSTLVLTGFLAVVTLAFLFGLVFVIQSIFFRFVMMMKAQLSRQASVSEDFDRFSPSFPVPSNSPSVRFQSPQVNTETSVIDNHLMPQLNEMIADENRFLEGIRKTRMIDYMRRGVKAAFDIRSNSAGTIIDLTRSEVMEVSQDFNQNPSSAVASNETKAITDVSKNQGPARSTANGVNNNKLISSTPANPSNTGARPNTSSSPSGLNKSTSSSSGLNVSLSSSSSGLNTSVSSSIPNSNGNNNSVSNIVTASSVEYPQEDFDAEGDMTNYLGKLFKEDRQKNPSQYVTATSGFRKIENNPRDMNAGAYTEDAFQVLEVWDRLDCIAVTGKSGARCKKTTTPDDRQAFLIYPGSNWGGLCFKHFLEFMDRVNLQPPIEKAIEDQFFAILDYITKTSKGDESRKDDLIYYPIRVEDYQALYQHLRSTVPGLAKDGKNYKINESVGVLRLKQ